MKKVKEKKKVLISLPDVLVKKIESMSKKMGMKNTSVIRHILMRHFFPKLETENFEDI